MTHIDNLKEIEKIHEPQEKNAAKYWYLKALKETEKETEKAFKEVSGSCNLICWQITPQKFMSLLKAKLLEGSEEAIKFAEDEHCDTCGEIHK